AHRSGLSRRSPAHHPDQHPLPTRRSSDLIEFLGSKAYAPSVAVRLQADFPDVAMRVVPVRLEIDGHLFDAEHPPLPEPTYPFDRSEEHTSELQSREKLVCRLLLEKKNETT